MIHTLTERHLVPVSTSGTRLRRIGRVDLDELSASFFRFAGQVQEKGRPCRVTDTLCQTMSMHHAIDGQILNSNQAIPIDYLSAFLMGEIIPSKGDAFMHPR